MAGENFRKVGFYGLAKGLVAFEWFFWDFGRGLKYSEGEILVDLREF